MISKKIKNNIAESQDWKCALCGKPLQPDLFELHHKLSLSKGGDNSINNLEALHLDCHRSKDLALVSGTVTSTGGFITKASEVMGDSINWLERIPASQREKMGINEVAVNLISVKQEMDELRKRLSKLESTFDEADLPLFEEYKKERNLFIPEEIEKNLPKDVTNNIEVIRKVFNAGVPNACAPFLRKTLESAIDIRFKQDGEDSKLYNDKREPFSLPKRIEIAKQKGYLSSYLAKHLKEVKLFGDVGIHDYKVVLKEEDVIPIFKTLRISLEHMYHEKTKRK